MLASAVVTGDVQRLHRKGRYPAIYVPNDSAVARSSKVESSVNSEVFVECLILGYDRPE